ncbi:MAG: LytTR family transcriptional regulator DNA-binding domain-containing protein [Clostridium sp.]|nr:LytTR family transcriptional regulator DNA-binding domain-containing protein [Clostridium sp.]
MAVVKKDSEKAAETFRFPFVEGSTLIAADELIYVETDRHRNLFHTTGRVYSIYRKLDEIERQLDGTGFVRVHRSFLVNMRYIRRISSYLCHLKTGEQISVPKPRYPYVKKQFELFLTEKDAESSRKSGR